MGTSVASKTDSSVSNCAIACGPSEGRATGAIDQGGAGQQRARCWAGAAVRGLVLGLVFFAAVGGMAIILSLFFQQGRGTSPAGASLGLVPMALGIVVAYIAAAGLIQKLGRILILAGLLIPLAGVASLSTVMQA